MAGVAVAGAGTGLLLPSASMQSVVEVAWQASLRVWGVETWDAPTLAQLAALRPDAIIVACWPRRLPETLLTLPRWGCFNVHPSLLPDYRGPAPLFWQRRDGLTRGGVTIHQMSAQLDEGPLLLHAPVRLPDGATGEELDRLLARRGAQLLDEGLRGLSRGTLRPTPQPPGGSYQGWPTEQDFTVPLTWPARHAWNFMRATDQWQHPFLLPLPDGPLHVGQPRAFLPRATLSAPLVRRGTQVAVGFAPGVVLWEGTAVERYGNR